MNKRILSPFLFFFLYTMLSYAGPVDISTAQKIAKSFYASTANSAPAKMKSSSPLELKLAYTAAPKESQNSYYIFNRENQNGFIIISGDDRINAVLGYADSGSFDYNTIPDNFKFWLDCYREAIENLSDHSSVLRVKTDETLIPVEPLLGNIAYNQDAPYNNSCPKINAKAERAVTGCAATAMAQVMRYHKYPVQGIGSHEYTTKTLRLPLSADFAHTTYDWDNMLETYKKGTYTDKQADAIATLMFHCGVAIDMDYNTTSSALDFNQVRAFVNYFNYDASTIKLLYRDFYTSTEWMALVKQELDAKRPIIYNGQSVGGGHSFVCDGYDANGLFHINWGWNGNSNGYFELNVLDPGLQGIGGGVAGFNYSQSMITGIKPLQGTQTTPSYDLRCMGMSIDKESITGQDKAIVSFIMANYGVSDFNGEVGLHFEADNGDTKDISLGRFNMTSGAFTGSIPMRSREFPDGTYKLYISCKATDSDQWQKIEMPVWMPEYVLVSTQNGTTTISEDAPQSNPEVSDFKAVGELVTGEAGTFEFTVTNTGDKEFNQAMGVLIMPQSQITSTYQIFWVEGMYLPEGESKKVQYSNEITLRPGKYNAYAGIYMLGTMVPVHDNPLEIEILSEYSSISEVEEHKIAVYPNPVASTLSIHTDENMTNVQIMDLSGKTVIFAQPGHTNNTSINVESIPAGTYMVRISTVNEIITRKIMKQ